VLIDNCCFKWKNRMEEDTGETHDEIVSFEQPFYFFQTMIDLFEELHQSHGEEREKNKTSSLLKLSTFRNFILEKKGKNLDAVRLMTDNFLHFICKPQKLLYDHPEFYIATDYVTNTYVICFRDLTMIDVDLAEDLNVISKNKPSQPEIDKEKVLEFCTSYLEWLIDECEHHKDWRFGIYRSRKGLHVFALHKVFEREERCEFQLKLKCDFYYSLFTYMRRGCAIRLNRKKQDELPLYHFIGFLGSGETNPHLLELMYLHAKLPPHFQHLGLSGMR